MTQATQAKTAQQQILVQIAHLDGPKKGEIREFNQERITIGRDPTNDIVFPSDYLSISRHHAELIRDGNEYLFISLGKNSCLLDQTALDRAYLQSGDQVWLTQKGPTISFQTIFRKRKEGSNESFADDLPPLGSYKKQQSQTTEFTLQYGVALKSMQVGCVRLGSSKQCDFIVNHPFVEPIQADIIFREESFFIRDVSGNGTTLVNHDKASPELLLQQNDIITLGPQGARLQFLGDGKFAEFRAQHSALDTTIFESFEQEKSGYPTTSNQSTTPKNKGFTFIKSLFDRIWP